MVPRFNTKSVTDLSEPDIILISTEREVHNNVKDEKTLFP